MTKELTEEQKARRDATKKAWYENNKEKQKEYQQVNAEKIKHRRITRVYTKEQKAKKAETAREWRKANPEYKRILTEEQKAKHAEKTREWRKANPEYNKEYCKEYFKINKEKRKKQQKEYYIANKEKIKDYLKEYHKEYLKKNKEKIKEKSQKYYKANIKKRKEYDIMNAEKIKQRNKEYNRINTEKRKKYLKTYNTSQLLITSVIASNLAEYENIQMSECGQYAEVQCLFCKTWFIPAILQVNSRISAIIGHSNGENNLYCSDSCKALCPVYKQQWYPKGLAPRSSNRPYIDPWVIEQALERDDYECQRCGSQDDLQVHHIQGATQFPEYANDLENLITFCDSCHYEYAHQLEKCSTYDLRQQSCEMEA
ncbi:MAG: HNH endonuclease [Desulfamplus sp.]|nr:HNH endonuclease [Desulfamplus sp.]